MIHIRCRKFRKDIDVYEGGVGVGGGEIALTPLKKLFSKGQALLESMKNL